VLPRRHADALVVAKVGHLGPKYSRLNPRPDRDGQRIEPLSKRILAIGSDVLSNCRRHPELAIRISYMRTILKLSRVPLRVTFSGSQPYKGQVSLVSQRSLVPLVAAFIMDRDRYFDPAFQSDRSSRSMRAFMILV
jgi:hypothetical protein